MRTCTACGGILGRDCFNEYDCMQISLHNEQYCNENYQTDHINQLQSEYYALIEAENKIEILTELLIKHNIPVPDLSTGNLYYYGIEENKQN